MGAGERWSASIQDLSPDKPGVPAMRINLVVNCKRPVTADLALRLGRYFGQNPRYWMNLQSRYDMDVAEDALSERVMCEVRPLIKSGSDSHSYL